MKITKHTFLLVSIVIGLMLFFSDSFARGLPEDPDLVLRNALEKEFCAKPGSTMTCTGTHLFQCDEYKSTKNSQFQQKLTQVDNALNVACTEEGNSVLSHIQNISFTSTGLFVDCASGYQHPSGVSYAHLKCVKDTASSQPPLPTPPANSTHQVPNREDALTKKPEIDVSLRKILQTPLAKDTHYGCGSVQFDCHKGNTPEQCINESHIPDSQLSAVYECVRDADSLVSSMNAAAADMDEYSETKQSQKATTIAPKAQENAPIVTDAQGSTPTQTTPSTPKPSRGDTTTASSLTTLKVSPCQNDDLPKHASAGIYNDKGQCSNITCLSGYKPDTQRTACIVDKGASCEPASLTSNAISYEYADNNGTAECVVTKCKDDYKVSDDKANCEVDKGKSCKLKGEQHYKTAEINDEQGTAVCKIEQCDKKYTLDSKREHCVLVECDLSDLHATSTKLDSNNQCEPANADSCESGYHYYVDSQASKAQCVENSNQSCTPSRKQSDKRATEYFWNSTTSSCLIAKCTNDYVLDSDQNKCVPEKKAMKQLDKDYVKDFEQLLDAYDKVAKKYIENCLKDSGTIEEWKCHKKQQ